MLHILNGLSAPSRYVRHLDSTIHAIQTKTKLCQLVEAVSASILVHFAVFNRERTPLAFTR